MLDELSFNINIYETRILYPASFRWALSFLSRVSFVSVYTNCVKLTVNKIHILSLDITGKHTPLVVCGDFRFN